MKILIVEDDLSILTVLESVLTSLGYETYAVPTCPAAERVMDRVTIHAAIVDYLLEDGTCDPLTESLRDRHIPFILITAAARAEDIARRLFADDLVKKPFDIEELDRKLHETLKKSQPPKTQSL